MALLCVAGVVIVIGVVGVARPGSSVTTSVKNFLFDWETKDYSGAAALTTGNLAAVARQLQLTSAQLGANDLSLAMGPISVQGNHAHVYFNAAIDLGRGGLSWQYQGNFRMRRTGTGWLVVWSPSVIAPGLGPGDRLAVLTKAPRRAPLLDSSGRPLIRPSSVVEVGVYPGAIANPAVTARALARAVHLPPSDADEMTGYILAAPPQSFLELVQLSPFDYHKLARAINTVPGRRYRTVTERLFDSTVPMLTGQVGTEISKMLVQDGEPYLPGTTVGLSGLEAAFQGQLAGTPTTKIVVQSAKTGQLIKVLKVVTQGDPGTPVRTTIDGQIQLAARNALAGLAFPAAVVAVQAADGQILAVAQHTSPGMPAVEPLTGQYQPGQAFTIISTAALLAGRSIVPGQQLPCVAPPNRAGVQDFRVGGQTFTNVPSEPNLGAHPTFRVDFAHACNTAFALVSYDLTGRRLAAAAANFGLGVPWQLPVAAATGGMKDPGTSQGELAADATGTGTVHVSPLNMALAAGVADSGAWHPPSLVVGQREPPTASPGTFPSGVINQLRRLMRGTVTTGAASAARLPGLFGQVGTAPLAGHPGLRAIWFVGYRGNVAFAVLAFSHSKRFDNAVTIARRFAAALSGRS
jgi:cell division protein FtsI/penicillin-binding protein 2